MHGGARVGLGQHKCMPCAARSPAPCDRSFVDGLRRCPAQASPDPSREWPSASASPSSTGEVVLAVAEEREVVVGEPTPGTPSTSSSSTASIGGGCRSSSSINAAATIRASAPSPRPLGAPHRARARCPRRARGGARRSVSRTTSACMIHSEIASSPAAPGSRTSSSTPCASRRTRITGWIIRSIE